MEEIEDISDEQSMSEVTEGVEMETERKHFVNVPKAISKKRVCESISECSHVMATKHPILNSNKSVGEFANSLLSRKCVFIDGSQYTGTWDAVSMSGIGKYILPNGVVFEGEMRNGAFHGYGKMTWPTGSSISGVWRNGKLRLKRYTFADGLIFEEKNWKYCQFPDRRFYNCITDGLRPANITLKTNCQPTKTILPDCYDAGNGVYYPKIYSIVSYNSKKIIEIPGKRKVKWIKEYCRKGQHGPTGYQPWLYENWHECSKPELPYYLALSNDSPHPWWERLTTFERDYKLINKEEPMPLLCDHEMCYCCCYADNEAEENNADEEYNEDEDEEKN